MAARNDLIEFIVSHVSHCRDRRGDLPRHSVKDAVWQAQAKAGKPVPTEDKHWGRRRVYPVDEQGEGRESAIQGIVIHQSAGNGTPDGINSYHIGPNHISATGAPRACYFAIIDDDNQGTIHIMNDLEDITWSQGGHGTPVPGTSANVNFIGICVVGNFDGPGYKGDRRGPSAAQMASLDRLVTALNTLLGLEPFMVFGHYHFGKPACPGTKLQEWVEARRLIGVDKLPNTVRQWQQMLVDLGYDLGKSGPKGDGVDGDWGAKSRMALLAFQQSNRALDTGMRDQMTAVELAREHARWVAGGSPVGQCVP